MKAMSQSIAMENIAAFEPAIDPRVAEQVGQEILQNRLDPAVWATALAASGGKKQDALAAYARIRIQRLAKHRKLCHAKIKSFESRRLTQCFGVKTVQDLLLRSHPEKQLNFLKPRLSVVSLLILCIGSAGWVGASGRLLGGMLSAGLAGILPVVAVLAGLMVVATAVGLRFMLPKRWIMLGWNTGLLCACTMACFGSLVCGVKLIARAAPFETVQAAAPVAVTVVSVSTTADQALASAAQ
jgi:hypothetical protein